MTAIFKRELKAYFDSPIGYILIAIFCCLTGGYFALACVLSLNSDLAPVFQFISTWVLMVFAPILTMKLFSEERKLKTDQLLITSPVSLTGIVMGKFLSAMCMFLIAMCINIVYLLVATIFGHPLIASFIGNFIGVTLLAGAVISMGLFISSLTENQVVAAFASFGLVIGLLLLSSLSSSVTNPVLASVINWVSIYNRFQEFNYGVCSVESLIYYISITVIFLFLTVRVLEKRRWS